MQSTKALQAPAKASYCDGQLVVTHATQASLEDEIWSMHWVVVPSAPLLDPDPDPPPELEPLLVSDDPHSLEQLLTAQSPTVCSAPAHVPLTCELQPVTFAESYTPPGQTHERYPEHAPPAASSCGPQLFSTQVVHAGFCVDWAKQLSVRERASLVWPPQANARSARRKELPRKESVVRMGIGAFA
jgi:hypothetical protein